MVGFFGFLLLCCIVLLYFVLQAMSKSLTQCDTASVSLSLPILFPSARRDDRNEVLLGNNLKFP